MAREGEAFLLEQLNLESPSALRASSPHLPSRKHLRFWISLLIVWIIGGLYEARYLRRGWVPHDEGGFAESAERVLHGQMPHRDYVEIYTGGLAYLHAFAFRCLGESFATPRFVLFAVFLAWIPVFFWTACRFAPDWVAAGVTLLAIAWSLPNYSAAVPSWYNLFFATFGLAALFRFLEVRSAKWLFVAGLCGGFSVLAKIVGLYYVAAVLLFFLFVEQSEGVSNTTETKHRSLFYTSCVALSMLLLIAGVAMLIRPRASLEVDLDFVIPCAAVALILLFREQRAMRCSSRDRFATLLRLSGPFGVGLLIPVLVFLVPFIRGGGLHALVNGLFVLPLKRLSGAYADPPEIATIVPTLCLIALFALGALLRGWAL